jgi:hypothetical protein
MWQLASSVALGAEMLALVARRVCGFCLLAALALLVPAGAAHALDADTMRDALQKNLPGALSLTLGVPLRFVEAPSLIPAGDGFDVGLADVRAEIGTDASRVEVGFDPITGHLTPGKDGYILDLVLPKDFTLLSGSDVLGHGQLKGGTLSLHWSAASAFISRLDLKLDGVAVAANRTLPAVAGTIGPVALHVDAAADLGTVQRSRSVGAGTLRFSGRDGKSLGLGWQSIEASDDYRIDKPLAREEQKHIGELMNYFSDPLMSRTMDKETVSGVLLPLLDLMLKLRSGDDPAGKGQSRSAIAGLKVEGPEGMHLNVAHLSSASDVDGKTLNRMGAVMKLAAEGVSLAGAPAELAPYVPSQLHLDFNVSPLPVYDLLRQLSRSLHAQIKSGAPLKDMDPAPFLDPMTKARTGITVDRLQGEAPALGISGAGSADLDETAPHGVLGGGTLTIRGLDEAAAALARAADHDPRLAKLVPAVSIIAAVGKQTTVGGKPARQYDLKASPDGALTINGVDLGVLMLQ